MREWIIMQMLALPAAFILDMILGDPHTGMHPICLIGNLIAMLDSALNKENVSRKRKIARGALTAGCCYCDIYGISAYYRDYKF